MIVAKQACSKEACAADVVLTLSNIELQIAEEM